MTANEFYSLIKDSVGILIDVRTLEEFDSGYIENAIHVDYYKSNFQVKLDSMDKSVPVFVYCRSGNRSSIAAQIMKSMDFEQIYNLKDGIVGWEQEKLELIK